MEKRISVTEFRAIKRIAQAVNPLVVKKNKLEEQIKELVQEYNSYKEQIKGMEHGVIAMTGYQSEDLIKKVVEPNGKFDKEGRPLKETKYLPTDLIHRDEVKGDYIIVSPEPSEAIDESISTETTVNQNIETNNVNA